jgi:hypothetical protein
MPGAYVPPGPLETSPGGSHHNAGFRRMALGQVLRGVELGAWDVEVLDWLSRADDPTVRTLCSLIHRARLAGP